MGNVLLGLDPGGHENFGWCIVDDSTCLPTAPRASGRANSAPLAIKQALEALGQLPSDGCLAAAGIDAPLFWSPSGSRIVDELVRVAIRKLGAPHAAGTVQNINSLRGACLVQGMLAALQLRERFPSLPITEAHPKALRWLLPEVAMINSESEHERDAFLAALTAWAVLHKPAGWSNLLEQEANPYSPVEQPLFYTMPNILA